MATTVKTFTWNSDLESFTTSTAGSTGNATAERDASNGSTAAGSLHSYCVGRRDESIGTFTLSGASWEDLGVPAGKVVTAVQVTGIETYYGLVHDNVSDDFGPVTVSLGGTQIFSRALSASADGAWQSGSGSSSPISDEASTATNDIVIVATADSGNNASAAAGVHVDDLELTITYENPAFTATGSPTIEPATVSGTGASLGNHDATGAPSLPALAVVGVAEIPITVPIIQSVGATNSASSVTSLTLTKPTGLAVGDLMVAFLATQDGNPSTTFSRTGWTAAATPDSGGASRTSVLYREADSADVAASDFQFTSSGTSETCGGFIYRIDGHDSDTPLAAVAQTNETTSANPVPPSSGTVDSGDYLCLTSVSYENDFVITHPSGYTEDVELLANYTRDMTLAAASKDCIGITSEQPGNWTDVTLPYHTWTILVAPTPDAGASGTGDIDIASATVAGTATNVGNHDATGAVTAEAVTVAGDATSQQQADATGAVTLPSSTVSGTATQTYAATGAISGQAVTVAGDGTYTTVSRTATGAIDLTSVTAAGVAEVLQSATATGAAALASVTVAGVAAQAYSATGSVTGSAATVSGTADQAMSSTGAVSLESVTVSGAAAQSYAATGGITGASPVVSGAAESLAAAEATGAVTLAGLSVVGSADVAHSATGAILTGSATVSGSAVYSEGFVASAAVVGAAVTATGSGVQTLDSSGAISGEPVTVNATASLTASATGAASVEPVEVTGSAQQKCVATGDIALTAPTFDGTGTFATSATGDIDLASATVAGTGAAVVAHTATGSISLPVIDVDGTGDNGAYVAPQAGGSPRRAPVRQRPARQRLVATGDISLPAMVADGEARYTYDDTWLYLAPELYLAGVIK